MTRRRVGSARAESVSSSVLAMRLPPIGLSLREVHVSDVGRENPAMPFRVHGPVVAVAVRLVDGLGDDRRARGFCTREMRVDVVDATENLSIFNEHVNYYVYWK